MRIGVSSPRARSRKGLSDLRDLAKAPAQKTAAAVAKAAAKEKLAAAPEAAAAAEKESEVVEELPEEEEPPAEPTARPPRSLESKPSPRDVRRERGAVSDRDRRLPLDEEEGWFGCQVTSATTVGWWLLLPLAAIALRRRP